jgi:cell division protein ZapB
MAMTLIDNHSFGHSPLGILMMTQIESAKTNIQQLEQQISRLLDIKHKLEQENASLLARQETLVVERANLLGKNEQARHRVEGVLNRLKAMEKV